MTFSPKNNYFIVRHGQAENNVLGIESCKMETQEKYGLTSIGVKTVKKEAEKFNDFDLIYSSPFRRTRETAEIFAETSGCEINFDKRLVDVDLGELDEKSYELSDQIAKENPDVNYLFPGGESFSNVLQRLQNFLEEVNNSHTNKKILIVSHGFPCETLLGWANGKELKNWDVGIEKGKVFPL